MMSRAKSDVLTAIAESARNAHIREQEEIMGKVRNHLIRLQHLRAKVMKQFKGSRVIDHQVLEDLYTQQHKTAIDAGLTEEYWSKTLLEANRAVYGDPQTMWDNLMTQHHRLPYHNPTAHRLNVHALGLTVPPTEGQVKCQFQDWVEPGEIVYIPFPDTQGGKHSAIAGVAPQLVPCPRQEENLLDLTPSSYAEWCTYMSGNVLSPCCYKAIVWSDLHARLMCAKCGERCTGR
jgi:hypothetical protein